MILKNFINFINIFNLSLMLLFIFLINQFLITTNIRQKFLLLMINILVISAIGFYYKTDGLVLMFLVCELSVLLIFIILYAQIYNYYKLSNKINTIFFVIIIICLNFNYYEINLLNFNNFYTQYNILLNDFTYIYILYFEKLILLTIFTLWIITLFSIFFILLYFSLKNVQQVELNKKKNIFLLRKQNMLHQSHYNTTIRILKIKNKCFKKILFQYLAILVEFY